MIAPVFRGKPAAPLWGLRDGVMVPLWAEDPCDPACCEEVTPCQRCADNPVETIGTVSGYYDANGNPQFDESDSACYALIQVTGEPSGSSGCGNLWLLSYYDEQLGQWVYDSRSHIATFLNAAGVTCIEYFVRSIDGHPPHTYGTTCVDDPNGEVCRNPIGHIIRACTAPTFPQTESSCHPIQLFDIGTDCQRPPPCDDDICRYCRCVDAAFGASVAFDGFVNCTHFQGPSSWEFFWESLNQAFNLSEGDPAANCSINRWIDLGTPGDQDDLGRLFARETNLSPLSICPPGSVRVEDYVWQISGVADKDGNDQPQVTATLHLARYCVLVVDGQDVYSLLTEFTIDFINIGPNAFDGCIAQDFVRILADELVDAPYPPLTGCPAMPITIDFRLLYPI